MNHAAVIHELTPAPDPERALQALSDWPDLILFDSSLPRSRFGRHSFLAANPLTTWELNADGPSNPFEDIRQALEPWLRPAIPDLPPFQGGAAGLLTYEFGRRFEALPVPSCDVMSLPGAIIALYPWTLAWDHQSDRCWFIGQSCGSASKSSPAWLEDQYRTICQALSRQAEASKTAPNISRPAPEPAMPAPEGFHRLLSLASGPADLHGNFQRSSYLSAVKQVIEYIHAGDIFQANLSQQFLVPAFRPAPIDDYLALRRSNPAPFAGYFQHADWSILSSSPERFLQVQGKQVVTRPIKGTRQRKSVPEADLYTRDELRESDKDLAENVMIVDLMRNDLSRVCQAGTVRVPELCQVEMYETVAHLVSEVTGELRNDASFWSLLAATFPGGSITGAPKIRAMQIITELEQVARGAYCGSLFYHGFNGFSDSSILIRTMTRRNGWIAFPAGGGVVAQSDPAQEYAETLHKAQGMLRSLP